MEQFLIGLPLAKVWAVECAVRALWGFFVESSLPYGFEANRGSNRDEASRHDLALNRC